MKGDELMEKIKQLTKGRAERAEEKAAEDARAEARSRIAKQIEEMGIDLEEHRILLADGFEDAFIGIVERFNDAVVACYDKTKCLEILEKQGLDAGDALEYFEYNVIGAWMGDYTPVFLTRGCPAQWGACEKIRRPVATVAGASADAAGEPVAPTAAPAAADTNEK